MMIKPTLGWQSWSPPTPNLFHLPRRDYQPKKFHHTALTATTAKHQSRTQFIYWCSWYALGYFPSAKEILAQAKLIRKYKLAIDYILIDDGWQDSWLPDLCSSLHSLGFKVGLWYAPYTRHKSLPTYETLKYLIESCKLDLLKLDFLYQPHFDQNIDNPHQVLASLFDFLKTKYPNLVTIGCGVPFSDAINMLNVIRLSKDTALPFPTPHLLNQLFYSHRLNMLFQKYLAWKGNKLFIPDPDVRMFSLDTSNTNRIWGKMSYKIKGIGDNFADLSNEQIKNAKLWLKH